MAIEHFPEWTEQALVPLIEGIVCDERVSDMLLDWAFDQDGGLMTEISYMVGRKQTWKTIEQLEGSAHFQLAAQLRNHKAHEGLERAAHLIQAWTGGAANEGYFVFHHNGRNPSLRVVVNKRTFSQATVLENSRYAESPEALVADLNS